MKTKIDGRYVSKILNLLKREYSSAMRTSLHHSTPWELLVATILSAQSQDAQVNRVTPALFKKFDNIENYAKLRPSQIYPYIKSLGLYRGKGRNIIASAKMIERDFDLKIPRTMEDLVKLPGVGRKTANVVLSNAFGLNAGIAIDTHCITVSNRLGLARTRDAAKIEERLMPLLPREEWNNISHLFIALGRDTCQARVKYCGRCVLKRICPSGEF
jgi:endonuclease-3